jgi:hypothetical protein
MERIHAIVYELSATRLRMLRISEPIRVPEDIIALYEHASSLLKQLSDDHKAIPNSRIKERMIQDAPTIIDVYCALHLITISLLIHKFGPKRIIKIIEVFGKDNRDIRRKLRNIMHVDDSSMRTKMCVQLLLEAIESQYRLPRTDYENIMNIVSEYRARFNALLD